MFLIIRITKNQDGEEQKVTDRTAPIKFTATTVREVAARAKNYTGGAFALQTVGQGEGEGTRYIDAHTDRVWYSAEGARQACAYYIGGMLGMAYHDPERGLISDEDTAYLKLVQAAYMEGSQRHKDDMLNWEAMGRDRARLIVQKARDGQH